MPPKPAAQRSPRELVLAGKRARKRKRKFASPHRRQGDRADDDDAEPQRKFLTGPAVCQRYSISDMSLWRWLQDASLGFPPPTLLVRGRRFWDEAILRKWEEQRIGRAS